MRKHLLFIILAFTATSIMAAPVTQETTQRMANFFFHEHGGKSSITHIEAPQFPHIHFYKASNDSGFIVMSADDVVFPVLAYSTTNSLDLNDIPTNAAYWLHEYENQIRWNIENGHTAAYTVTKEWQLLGNMMSSQMKTRSQKAPQTYNTDNLLTTTWAQNPRYNDLCPYDSVKGQRTITGCVATAMAQIMKYWEHPLRGVGSYSYNDPPYGWQSADFSDTIFDYANMPDILDSYSTQAQRGAVALLMRRCGIAVEMEYGTDGSSAATIGNSEIGYKSAENALRENFRYVHTLHSVALADYTDSEWVALLQNEINNGRPVIYSAGNDLNSSGHSFICSGYDNTGKLYFNWGWNGSDDGYYAVGQLNPTSSRHYNQRNKAIIGIEPDTTDAATCTVTLSSNIPDACTLYGDGTYTAFVDTVKIMALANPGYVIDGWTDGLHYNPYGFIANGGNISHTANCTKITGDTIGYCIDKYNTAYGNSSSYKTHKWAIRLDSASIAPQRMLSKVAVFFHTNGQYTIEICYGNDSAASSTVLACETVNITDADQYDKGYWQAVALSNPVAFDRSQSLWIVFSWTGKGYPMSCSEFHGNIDGAWKYDISDGSWYNYATDSEIYISWMIKGIFEYDPKADLTNTTTENIAIYSNGNDIITENAEGETVYIYDATGRLLMTKTITTSHETIPTSLPAATYFVKINNKTIQVIVNR